MRAKEPGGAATLRAAASQCGLDPLLLAAVLGSEARREIKELEATRAREIETGFRQLALRKERVNLVMGVVLQVFAMGYLVAILLLAPLLLAPTGLVAAAYLWRRR